MYSSRVASYTRARAIRCSSDLTCAFLEIRKARMFRNTTHPASTRTTNSTTTIHSHSQIHFTPQLETRSSQFQPSSTSQAHPRRGFAKSTTPRCRNHVSQPLRKQCALPIHPQTSIDPPTNPHSNRKSPHPHSRWPHPHRHTGLLRPSHQPRASGHDRAHYPRARRRRALERAAARLISGARRQCGCLWISGRGVGCEY